MVRPPPVSPPSTWGSRDEAPIGEANGTLAVMDPRARAAWQAERPGHHPFDTACVAPSVSIEFDPSGWVYGCCTSQLYPLGRIGRDRLADLWNGPRAQALRESLEHWDLSVACGPCRWHLQHGRMDPVAAVYDRYPAERRDPERPYMMLFALSNRCNLGCVMCTPELSSTLRHEAGAAPLPSPYDDQFFEDLEPMLEGIGLAKFLGGEPFLAPEHRRVWDLLGQLPTPPRQQVTTNGTVWTDLVDSVLARFDIDISISVDASTASTYASIRRGGDFDVLMRNVDRFDEYCRSKGTDMHVSYCLMTSNWHELGSFLRWAERFDSTASVNLVTDKGLALHELDTDTLLAVRRAWETEDRSLSHDLRRNLGTWETQLSQLESVLEDRRRGEVPAPRQAEQVPATFFIASSPAPPPSDPAAALIDHVSRLRRWSTDGTVGVLHGDDSGTITAVTDQHRRLGITERMVGHDIGELPAFVSSADGRPAWVIEHDELDDATVRTLILSATEPQRGTVATVVRTVQVPSADGWHLAVAEDRMYDEVTAVDVEMPTRR